MGDNRRFYGRENGSRMIALNYCYCHALCYCDRFLLRAWDFYNFHSVYNPSYSIRVLYCHLLSQQYTLSTIIILLQNFVTDVFVFIFSLEIERLQRVQEELADEIRTLRKHPDTVVTLLPPLVPNSPSPPPPTTHKNKRATRSSLSCSITLCFRKQRLSVFCRKRKQTDHIASYVVVGNQRSRS